LFQTGVDEGESTTWTLPNALDPATLSLSKVVASATSTNSVVGASYTVAGATTTGTLNNMSELATGDYSFEVLDKATAAAQGKANLDTSSKLVTGVGSMGGATTAASLDAMVSGRYKLTIDAASSATSTSYTVTNLDDNTWGNNGSISATDDLSSTADTGNNGDLVDSTGATLGLNIAFTAGYATGAADLVAGQSMTFEYIAGGQVKVELNDSSGQALQINRQASDYATSGDNYSATSAYVDAGTAYQSGRGASVTLAAFGTVSASVGNKATFTYEQANNFSVDVSNAAKAGKYMTTANNALDKVTSALSDLGSLMSRLTFKEDSISTAQINVEAAHSRIMNANMAEEQMNASKYTILQQTAIAMLAQANQAPQNLLSLFR